MFGRRHIAYKEWSESLFVTQLIVSVTRGYCPLPTPDGLHRIRNESRTGGRSLSDVIGEQTAIELIQM